MVTLRLRPGGEFGGDGVQRVDLQPKVPLSSVVFIFDYVQLVFQDCTFTLFNRIHYLSNGHSVIQGTPGFCDALVGLIDSDAMAAVVDGQLSLRFTNGATVRVGNADDDISGPEAWTFATLDGEMVVQQNS